jgi:cytochrome c oxidase assembly protein subunit 15
MAMACVTFPLIWMGGLVTTHQAGMAVPDWPNTYGYNLFLYPLSTWIAGPFDLFIEHGHRLLGALVGLLAIGFVLAAFRFDTRPWVRRLSLIALVGVCLQGSLGGMRVLFNERTLAMLHACVGPAFFSLAVVLVAITGRRWLTEAAERNELAAKLRRLALFTAALAYLQLVLGAQLRHTPIDASIAFFRTALYFHLLVAAALVVHIVMIARNAARLSAGCGVVRRSACALLLLISLQMALGASTWVVKYGWPHWLGEHVFTASYTVQREAFWSSVTITAHVATGSLILAAAVLLSVQSFRYLTRPDASASAALGKSRSAVSSKGILLTQRFAEVVA